MIHRLELGDRVEWGDEGEVWTVVGMTMDPATSALCYHLHFPKTGSTLSVDEQILAGTGGKLLPRPVPEPLPTGTRSPADD